MFFVAVALWFVWGGGGSSGLPEGQAAPALRVPWTAAEEPFDLGAERGHVVVLAFWATWCQACRNEGPILSRVERRIARSGDRVLGVSVDVQSLEAITQAARGFGMTYPIARGERSDTDRFGVSLLPTIIIVDKNGRVSASFAGNVSEERLLGAVERARNAS